MAKVNPPPALRIPQKINQDPDLRAYFEQIGTILFQLWTRTGGGNDDIADAGLDAGVADNKATQALNLLNQYIQESGVDQAVADAQITEVIQSIGRLSQEAALSGFSGESGAAQALGAIATLGQDTAVTIATLEAKLLQAQDTISKLAQSVELLALAPPPREFKRSRYGAFYDTTTQTAGTINTATLITYNTTQLSKGVYVDSVVTSRVYVDTDGIYNFQTSIQLDSTVATDEEFYLWFRQNGTDVVDSASQVRVKGNNAEVFLAINFFFDMKAGDYVELVYSVTNLGVRLLASGAVAPHPGIPSIILTVANNIEGFQ
jgi:hypothetical protein